MTANFFKTLYLGSELTDDQLEDIPHYRFELHWHVLNKGLQAGCILGMGVIGPLVGLIRGRSISAIKSAAIKGGKIGCGIMIPLSPIMTEGLVRRKGDESDIYDRSFRLRHNQGQLRVDRYATYAGLAGMGLSTVSGAGLAPGLMAGVIVGTVSGAIQTNVLSKK